MSTENKPKNEQANYLPGFGEKGYDPEYVPASSYSERATKAAMKAARRAEHIASASCHQMAVINQTLIMLSAKLQHLQPKEDGSITVDLKQCGNPCLGCPHPRWNKWMYHEENKINKWVRHDIQLPLRHVRKGGVFSANAERVVDTIKEIQYWLDVRARLVRALSGLTRVLHDSDPDFVSDPEKADKAGQ